MRNSNRRGMLLLVVLALLAMFAMLAVAFVVLAGAEKRSADNVSQQEVQRDPPEKLLNDAVNVVVSGYPIDPTQASTNPNYAVPSAITWQSLLEKIYGFETVGTLSKPGTLSLSQIIPICGGQLIEFTLPSTNPDWTLYPSTPFDSSNPKGAAVDPFHCVGCVLTMLDGPAAGLSTRIVGINPQTQNVQMVAFEGGVQPVTATYPNAHYIINGFPYSGMGFGFDKTSGVLTSTALTPNCAPSQWNGINGIIPGGVNSDYTAANYQDPLVALAVSDSTVGVFVPIPSLHRSDLIAYANAKHSGGILNNAAALRQVMFRPNSIDNPNFTGSNLNFNPLWDGLPTGTDGKAVNWQWDVDNMGAGRPDSVWVDLGMSVRHTADGKAYKPLFAILCLDMDGRLNLNAHGSLAQANANYYSPQSLSSYQSVNAGSYQFDVGFQTATGGTVAYAGPVSSGPTIVPPVPLPRGQGTGPAEVNLQPLFRNLSSPLSLLSGGTVGGNPIMGRYGPGIGAALPGVDGGSAPGSLLNSNNAFSFSGVLSGGTLNYWNASFANLDAYGSPPDMQGGMGAIGLDASGRPLYISMGGRLANSPYDIDLTRNAPHAVDVSTTDNAFGVAEMERILRFADRDATTLPSRLAKLTDAGTGSVLISRRAEFTVESNTVPVSAAVLPPALRKWLPDNRSLHPVDLLYAQVAKNMNLSPAQGAQTAQGVIGQLLPWEVMEGLKMDINRPFGAGAFSMAGTGDLSPLYGGKWNTTGKSQVLPDQPGMTNETVLQYTASGSVAQSQFNYSADAGTLSQNPPSPAVATATPVNDSLAARQLYARHLYVLMLALADTDAVIKDLQATNPSATYEDMARMFAQWAVNVVAFRDHNNIMIPFPYDLYPFGNASSSKSPGWAPDYSVLHTVWGCKRPELLITETLAFHDRRTQDLDTEQGVDPDKPNNGGRTGPGKTTDTDPKTIDPSFNSQYRPEGSLFVEFFNPWPTREPRTPDLAPADGVPGVELTKVTPQTSSFGSSPVWRMIIVDPTKGTQSAGQANGDDLPDPDNPTVALRPTIERVVYFVPVGPSSLAPNAPNDGKVTYCPSSKMQWPTVKGLIVAPGGYAVVGSGDPQQQNCTYIGLESGKTAVDPTRTRMIAMNQTLVNTDNRVVRNTNDSSVPASTPQVLGIDSPQRLSISEPPNKDGYVGFERDNNKVQHHPTVLDPSGLYKYDVTLDIPVDEQRYKWGTDPDDKNFGGIFLWSADKGTVSILNTDGTVAGYRIIYLQRLADPTRPWVGEGNPDPRLWNPYRTVDAMTVDLTVFNGLTTASDPTTTIKTPYFESHQRGEKNWWPWANNAENNLWKQEPALKGAVHGTAFPVSALNWQPAGWSGGGATPRNTMYFNNSLNQSLGCLNSPFVPPSATPPATIGDPQYPFPWMNWSYRPFNNVYELLQVPISSSSRLLARKITVSNASVRANYGYVDGAVRTAANGSGTYTPQAVYDGFTGAQVPYPHLLNFFESKKSSQSGSAQLHRLFAYLGVPSRFANAQLQMRADTAGGATGTNYFHTPFNRISRYREPGLINLNTITSSDVLYGAMNTYYAPLSQSAQLNPVFWDKFVRSRRGDGYTGPDSSNPWKQDGTSTKDYLLRINSTFPSRFMQPYRTPGGAALMVAEPKREADVTLLRSDPDVLLADGSTARPLFETDDYLFGGTPNTLLSAVGATPDQFPYACMDFNRNPYFRYQAMQKLGSVVSNHSNVFAIWITVGYFEVAPNHFNNGQPDAGHPDGWELGQELGADTGDVVRHRAFYIFDRSLPVGFIRGKDVNSDKAFLLKRFIE